MLVLRSDDAAADAEALRRTGLSRGLMLPFSRAAQGPDGSDRTVAFTVALAELPGLPEVGAFLCEQHRPENFWDSAAQHHPNGATGIARLTIRGPDPSAYVRGLRLFAEDDPGRTEPYAALANDAQVAVIRAADDVEAKVASVDVWAADLASAETSLRSAGIQLMHASEGLIVRSPALGETALVFRQKAH